MTLFNIGDDLRALAALMSECDDELSREASEAFDDWFGELSGNEAAKLDGYVGLIKTLEMEAAAAKAEAEQYTMKARSRENRAKWLKERVKGYLEATGRTKVETATKRTIAIQANGGALPVDYTGIGGESNATAVLPKEMVIVTRRPDTDAVRKALQDGAEIPGITLGTRGTHLRIR